MCTNFLLFVFLRRKSCGCAKLTGRYVTCQETLALATAASAASHSCPWRTTECTLSWPCLRFSLVFCWESSCSEPYASLVTHLKSTSSDPVCLIAAAAIDWLLLGTNYLCSCWILEGKSWVPIGSFVCTKSKWALTRPIWFSPVRSTPISPI